MRRIDQIILHCSATREGQPISVETIRDWHVRGNGWSDIGYHFVVQLDGTVNNGRPVERIGAHVRGKNRHSIGICYIGGVEDDGFTPKDTRTYEQKAALEELITNLLELYPDATLHGHNEFSAKACPSFDVQVEYSHFID